MTRVARPFNDSSTLDVHGPAVAATSARWRMETTVDATRNARSVKPAATAAVHTSWAVEVTT